MLFFLPSLFAANSGVIQVTGIHYYSHPDYTRIILDTTGPFEVHSERALNPDRIFFDIEHARPAIDGKRMAAREVNDRLLKRIRIAEPTPGATRVVLDLNVATTFKVSRLDKPDRMLIEIRQMKPEMLSRLTSPSPTLAAKPPASAPGPLPYVPTTAVPTTAGFVYPPGYGVAPSFRKPVYLTSAPVLYPTPLASPRLPDTAAQLALLKPPKKALIVRNEPATTVSSSLPPPAAAPAPAISTKVIPATKPLPYDAAPKASENASKSLTRALGLKVNRIVIDAGHGGHDDGTIGPNGVLEKDVVLDVALRLSKLVQSKMGAEVVLTRSDDTFIPLHQRTVIANDHKADLFLSIHANSSPVPSVAGTETFFLNFTNSPGALDVAARENAGSDKNVGELKDLIQSITLNDKIAESETFAQQIQNAIFSQAARSNVAAKNRGVKRAPFVVLIGAGMPSVLAEIGFLSNPRDESNLGKADYRQKIAESLLRGVQQYAQSLSHFEVAAKR